MLDALKKTWEYVAIFYSRSTNREKGIICWDNNRLSVGVTYKMYIDMHVCVYWRLYIDIHIHVCTWATGDTLKMLINTWLAWHFCWYNPLGPNTGIVLAAVLIRSGSNIQETWMIHCMDMNSYTLILQCIFTVCY